MRISAVRFGLAALALLAAVCGGALMLVGAETATAAPALPNVKLDASAAGPRAVEDLTGQSVTREYAVAWQSMSQALEQNRGDLLNRSFVGVARDKLGSKVASQAQNGLRTRIIDHGHAVKVAFYSPEGSIMQLLDTADVETQVLDGDKVLYTARGPVKYVAIMAVAESGWRVRELQAVPEFASHK